MIAKFRRLASMPREQRSLLFEAWLVLAWMKAALKLLPYRTVVRIQTRSLRRSARKRPTGREAEGAVGNAVSRATKYVPKATCLPQALAGQILLARRGVASDLRLGVARDDKGKFLAHAWLESEGRVVLGDVPGQTFHVLSTPE